MQNPLASDLDHVLSHTLGLWEELRGQRLFITGGTGFFGCWLLESFAWANRELNLDASAVVLTRDPDAMWKIAPHLLNSNAIQLWAGDVRTFVPPEGEFPYVIHAASAGSAHQDEDLLNVFNTSVLGTRRVLDAVTKWRTKKMLFTSSGAVYGPQPLALAGLPEDFSGAPDPVSKSSAYAESKRAAETLCALFNDIGKTEIKIARCFAFVGPYLPLNGRFAIGNFIRDEMAGGPIRVRGDGTDVRSYLYASDLAIWLWTILLKGRSCDPYNVGSEQAVSIAEAAQSVAEAGGHGAAIVTEGGSSPRPGSGRYVPNTRKARTELGLKEHVDLHTAERRTMDWHANHTSAIEREGGRTMGARS